MMPPKLTGNRCQCTVCGEVFSRERAFDRHRVGEHGVNRRCLTLGEMRARGWKRNKAGVWIMDPLKGAGKSRLRPSEHGGATPIATKHRAAFSGRQPARSRGKGGKHERG